METTQQQNDELEIDLMQLLRVLRSHLGAIVICAVLFALLALVGTKLLITPKYISTAKIYVLNRAGETESVTTSDLQSSSYLTQDYIELCKTRTVTEGTIARLELDLTHEELLEKLSVEEADDTRVISISVTDKDPYIAAKIAETITEIASEHIQTIMQVQAVQTADKANIPTRPSNVNTKKNIVIGFLAGILLAAAVIIITFLANDTLRTSEDVEQYLGLNVLGSIPLQEEERRVKKKKNHRRSLAKR